MAEQKKEMTPEEAQEAFKANLIAQIKAMWILRVNFSDLGSDDDRNIQITIEGRQNNWFSIP